MGDYNRELHHDDHHETIDALKDYKQRAEQGLTELRAEVERLRLNEGHLVMDLEAAREEVERLREQADRDGTERYAMNERVWALKKEVQRLRAAAMYWQKLATDAGLQGDASWAVWGNSGLHALTQEEE